MRFISIIVDRPLLAPNVVLVNEAPKEVLISNHKMHNESPHVPHAPEYIFFYSHKAPRIGGGTLISSSLKLFQRVIEDIPEFINTITKQGILSKVTYKVEKQSASDSTMKLFSWEGH
jgi:hypothetical protein